MDVFDIIEDRISFPFASKAANKDDLDYIDYALSGKKEQVGLILGQNTIDRNTINNKLIKEVLLSDWHIAGIFDLSRLMYPYTSIRFNFYWLTKKKPEQVKFSIYKDEETYISDKGLVKNQDEIKLNRKITPVFEEYLGFLNTIIKNIYLVPSHDMNQAEFFVRAFDEMDFDNLSIRYNSPEMVQNRLKLQFEKTLPLSSVAEILFPRLIKGKSGRVCKPVHLDNIRACLKSDAKNATDIEIQTGDILVTRLGQFKLALVEKDFEETVFASNYLIVIRPISDVINSEFLFLYFNSQTAQKYFMQFEPGVLGYYFSRDRISSLPIIIPDDDVLLNAKNLFEGLYKDENLNRVEIINRELFNTKIPQKPFQKDLIQEILNHLQIVKQHFIREVIESDLSEIATCINAGAYKSALILSGSVLEGVLLDWLSEIDKVDYINSKTHKKMLGEIISDLQRTEHLTAYLKEAAFKISGYRNIVHPKVFIQKKVNLDREIAEDILSDLRKILSKRLRDNSKGTK